MRKPRFQVVTVWPNKSSSINPETGDGFMFPDAQHGIAWLYDGDKPVLGFRIADGSELSGECRTILRIVQGGNNEV